MAQYIPDLTERYPEGMRSYGDERDWFLSPPDISECTPIEDVVASIKADQEDGDWFNKINIFTLGSNTKVAELHSVDELSRFSGDFVGTWNWHDATINVYLAYYTPSHISGTPRDMWISLYLQDGTQGGATLIAVDIDDAEAQLQEKYGEMWGGIADYGFYDEM